MARKFRQTKNSANSFWSNRLYQVDDAEIPTVTTDSVDMGFLQNADLTGTIVTNGGSELSSYGFVWSISGTPTLDDEVEEVGTSDHSGEFTASLSGLEFGETLYVRAYATNSVGTAYGSLKSGEVQICLAEGTMISTSRGDVRIEDITYDDDILVWNFDEAKLDYSKPIWMVRPFTSSWQSVVEFNNNTQLITVCDGKGHRIFNLNENKFTHMMNTPLNAKTIDKNGEELRVTKKEIIKKETTFYNVVTNKHFNVFANGILTSTGLNNIYPIQNMKFLKEKRESLSRDEFNIPDDLYYGLRCYEQPADYPNLKQKLNRMYRRQLLMNEIL